MTTWGRITTAEGKRSRPEDFHRPGRVRSRAKRTTDTCPACDAPVREEHGHTRCTNCGVVVETCCEGGPL